jgi:hypothetical protein
VRLADDVGISDGTVGGLASTRAHLVDSGKGLNLGAPEGGILRWSITA